MIAKHLIDLIADGHDRVERGHRLLKDHRDVAAANVTQPRLADLDEILIAEANGTLLDPHMGLRQQPHDRARGQRLTRTAFADDTENLVRRQLQINRFDGMATLRALRQRNMQVFNVQKW